MSDVIQAADEAQRVLIEDEEIRAAAMQAILATPMLDDVAVRSGLMWWGPEADKVDLLAEMRNASVLLALPSEQGPLYPAFQFEPDTPRARARVAPVVATINAFLGANVDPWGVASWWVSPNARLGGRAPMDLVATGEHETLLAMHDVRAQYVATYGTPRKQTRSPEEIDRRRRSVEMMQAYANTVREAKSPELTEERMREIVREALALLPDRSYGDLFHAAAAAVAVLSRPDCPLDLLMLVATGAPWDPWMPGAALRGTVLGRPDCPDEVRVAVALADPGTDGAEE